MNNKASCVRALLSHPDIDINIQMVARYTSRGVFKEMEACKDFRVHSYGKVVLCGNSGAGKSTLTQVGCLMYSLIHTGNQGLQYYFLLYMYSTCLNRKQYTL